MPYTPCTPTKRARIAQMHKAHVTFCRIADELGISESAAHCNWKKFHGKENWYQKTHRAGQPCKLHEEDFQKATEAIESGEVRNGEDLRRQLFPKVASSTIQRNLWEIGLNGHVRRAKPLLTDAHILKRQEWLEKHRDWTLEDWKKVWFSDESKFNLFGLDGKRYCCRRVGEAYLPRNVKKTMKHGGGSVMVWVIEWDGKASPH